MMFRHLLSTAKTIFSALNCNLLLVVNLTFNRRLEVTYKYKNYKYANTVFVETFLLDYHQECVLNFILNIILGSIIGNRFH